MKLSMKNFILSVTLFIWLNKFNCITTIVLNSHKFIFNYSTHIRYCNLINIQTCWQVTNWQVKSQVTDLQLKSQVNDLQIQVKSQVISLNSTSSRKSPGFTNHHYCCGLSVVIFSCLFWCTLPGHNIGQA